LVNTGWTGGPYGEGKRMPIGATRNLLSAALDGTLLKEDMTKDKFFGFEVPINVKGVNKKILNPRGTWKDKQNYDTQAFKLVQMFTENFESFKEHVDMEIIDAAPVLQVTE
jgi:phosphoenolpyruvate carboxykinase (ATP)